MRNLLAAVVVLGLGACGGKGDEALDKMESFKNQVCACSDVGCAEKAMKEMEAYLDDWQKKNSDTKPTKEQDQRADKIGDEMQACMKKLIK
jgi:hypothetical protein